MRVEWRVVNAADYGMPQRRRRVFIVGHLAGTPGHARADRGAPKPCSFAMVYWQGLPCTQERTYAEPVELDTDLARLSRSFNRKGEFHPWQNAGSMVNGRAWTLSVVPQYEGPVKTLGDVLQPEREVPFLPDSQGELDRWKYFRGLEEGTPGPRVPTDTSTSTARAPWHFPIRWTDPRGPSSPERVGKDPHAHGHVVKLAGTTAG